MGELKMKYLQKHVTVLFITLWMPTKVRQGEKRKQVQYDEGIFQESSTILFHILSRLKQLLEEGSCPTKK